MSEGRLVMEVGQYFGPSQPRRPTRDSPGIPDGQSAPAWYNGLQAWSSCPSAVHVHYVSSSNTADSDEWVVLKLSRSLIMTHSFESGVLKLGNIYNMQGEGHKEQG